MIHRGSLSATTSANLLRRANRSNTHTDSQTVCAGLDEVTRLQEDVLNGDQLRRRQMLLTLLGDEPAPG